MAECETPDVDDGPKRLPLSRVIDSILNAPEGDSESREREAESRRRYGLWCDLIRSRGERYENCYLKNFDTANDAQRAAVEALTAYCGDVGERIKRGEGIILFGPKGTGKDHLLVAVSRAAIRAGHTVRWENGMDLFGAVRDAIGKGDDERTLVHRLVAPDVLYLSDPLPPIGSLTDFQASMLFRVLDGRYSRRRPTWVTVNVSSGQELESRMGPQNGDRLKDGALAIFCDWPSYRKAK